LTFLSLLFWSFVIGPLGAILAIPLTLLAKALLLDVDPDTRWISGLLASGSAPQEPVDVIHVDDAEDGHAANAGESPDDSLRSPRAPIRPARPPAADGKVKGPGVGEQRPGRAVESAQ